MSKFDWYSRDFARWEQNHRQAIAMVEKYGDARSRRRLDEVISAMPHLVDYDPSLADGPNSWIGVIFQTIFMMVIGIIGCVILGVGAVWVIIQIIIA